MTTSTSLLDMILSLLRDPAAMAAYQDDPEGYLASCGDFTSEDVQEAIVLLQDNQDGDFSRDYNTGGNTIHVAPPSAPPHPQPGETEHEAAIKYLNTYITNNYVDDRDTITDNSINQQIDTDGGDFDQDIDIDSVVASGDGAVAAGDDIEDSTIVTGDDNQVGDGNVRGDGNVVGDNNQAVTGDGNTTSFGDGDATSTSVGGDVNVGDGGAFASGGDATVDNSDNSTNDSFNDNSDNSINDSLNDNSDNSVNDSGNTEVDVDVSDSGNDNSDNSINDSGNDNSDNSDNSHNSIDDSFNA